MRFLTYRAWWISVSKASLSIKVTLALVAVGMTMTKASIPTKFDPANNVHMEHLPRNVEYLTSSDLYVHGKNSQKVFLTYRCDDNLKSTNTFSTLCDNIIETYLLSNSKRDFMGTEVAPWQYVLGFETEVSDRLKSEPTINYREASKSVAEKYGFQLKSENHRKREAGYYKVVRLRPDDPVEVYFHGENTLRLEFIRKSVITHGNGGQADYLQMQFTFNAGVTIISAKLIRDVRHF